VALKPERAWHYLVDTDGHLWHDGDEFDDPEMLRLFMEKMEQLPDGRFRVLCQGETCYLTPEDVPYVVQDLKIEKKTIDLIFPGSYKEALDPTTLFVGKENVLYCKVRGGEFNARFNRKSYWELAKKIGHDSKKKSYELLIDNQKYPIKGVK